MVCCFAGLFPAVLWLNIRTKNGMSAEPAHGGVLVQHVGLYIEREEWHTLTVLLVWLRKLITISLVCWAGLVLLLAGKYTIKIEIVQYVRWPAMTGSSHCKLGSMRSLPYIIDAILLSKPHLFMGSELQ